MTKTVIYQGWRYDFDQARPSKLRWKASKGGRSLSSNSENGIKKMIDLDNEHASELRGLAAA